MATKDDKLDVTEDVAMQDAFQKYKAMKQIIKEWQLERGAHWRNMLKLAEKPPYLLLRDLPTEALKELWQRLNAQVGVEIPDAELNKSLAQISEGEEVTDLDTEMSTYLRMALGGVAQLAVELIAEQRVVNKSFKQEGQDNNTAQICCPLCDEPVSLAVVTQPDGKREMHCSLCGYQWQVPRLGCPHCGNEDADEQRYLRNEEFPGVEMLACLDCGQYIKEINARELIDEDYIWEDLKTLPLNFAAESWLKENAKKAN